VQEGIDAWRGDRPHCRAGIVREPQASGNGASRGRMNVKHNALIALGRAHCEPEEKPVLGAISSIA